MAGISTAITINVHTPRNFPVDLYYLTDVSRSIKKESIKSLGHLLGKQRSANVCLFVSCIALLRWTLLICTSLHFSKFVRSHWLPVILWWHVLSKPSFTLLLKKFHLLSKMILNGWVLAFCLYSGWDFKSNFKVSSWTWCICWQAHSSIYGHRSRDVSI